MKKLLTFILCAALALALAAPAAAYSDVSDSAWYAGAVEFCTEQGLMGGMGGDVFAPSEPVTRAQLVTTLWRLEDQPDAGAPAFTDVAADAWYAPAVAWAAAAGVTDGMGDGTFAPDAPLTREMLVTFFHRYMGAPAPAKDAAFSDAADIADWAQTAAAWALGAGLVQGKGEGVFDPQGGAKRAELAQVLKNFLGDVSAAAAPAGETLPDGCRPTDLAVTDDGALLVADGFNKVIWRVTAAGSELFAGVISPADVRGEPYGGYQDGDAAHALFASPWAIAPFMEGWAVSDPDNNTVRYVTADTVQTLNGIAFDMPKGLAAGADGVLYVADTGAGTVLRVTPEGESSVVLSGLEGPTGLAWADGVLYIAETDANRVWKLPDGGSKTLVAGSGLDGIGDGRAAEAAFSAPTYLAVGADGTVYVSDTANAAVRAVSPAGAVSTLLGRPGGLELALWPAAPAGLALRGGVLTVCDRIAGVLLDLTIG